VSVLAVPGQGASASKNEGINVSAKRCRKPYGALWVALGCLALLSAPRAQAQQGGAAMRVSVLQVVPGIDMITVDGVNLAVQSGEDGAVVVDTGPAAGANAALAAIQHVVSGAIHYVIDTGADAELVGGNAVLATAGHSVAAEDTFVAAQNRGFSAIVSLPGAGGGAGAPVIARQSVLTRLVSDPGASYSGAALPTDTFTRPEFNFYSSEPIAVVWLPNAHSDSDTAVRFQHSDVVVTGEVFDPTRFPVIDLAHGGSIQGEIAALNRLINTLVFAHTPVLTDAVGTLVIPVHGPLSDLDDLVSYRDMVDTVRARVQYYIDHGRSYRQIVAADPAQGFHTRYGSDTGSWTTADFVDAVYKGLMAERQGRKGRRGEQQ
jgi:glyoxylase-like metal-dependent hydrolase (beta-lactamase superfamily II)